MQEGEATARRPRLTPAVADLRRAVRGSLTTVQSAAHPADSSADVLVGLSGGPDSLALASAVAFEASRANLRGGAIIVDHGLQHGSAEVAANAARQAEMAGLFPVIVERVRVGDPHTNRGPEADARSARFAAFERARRATGASHVMLAHTLDDQAETVLLGLARGSGPTSLQGMAAQSGTILRPLLGIRRTVTHAACADLGLEPWHDPHNLSDAFARVRVRTVILPVLEEELGPGIAEALARTAEQLREDAHALDTLALEWALELTTQTEAGAVALDVRGLAADPPALRQRIIRLVVAHEFGVSLERVHTLAIADLVTNWHGQKALAMPGVRVVRTDGQLIFTALPGSKGTGTT